MNSSKMSLKEGFDFLFENEESGKKFEIVYNKEQTVPKSIKDCVAFVLTTDIVVSSIQGAEEPLLLKLLKQPQISKDIEFAQGKTISFQILSQKVKSFNGFKTFYNINKDNVSNISVFNSIGQVYTQSINKIVDSGATRMMLEAKENVLKIDRARYLQLFRDISKQSYIPQRKNQNKIQFTKIFQSISSRISSEGLLKTSESEGKYKKDESYTDLSDHEKVYEASVYFFKKLSTDQKRGFGGKKGIEDFLNLLSVDKKRDKSKPVREIVNQFKRSWGMTSKKVAKYMEKQFDEMIDSILGAESVAEVESLLDASIEELPTVDIVNASFGELKDNLEQRKSSESQDNESNEQDHSNASILEGLKKLVSVYDEKTSNAKKIANLYLSTLKSDGMTDNLLTSLETFVTNALTLDVLYENIKKTFDDITEFINEKGEDDEKVTLKELRDSLERIHSNFKRDKESILNSLKKMIKDRDIKDVKINIDSEKIIQDYTTLISLDDDEAQALKDLNPDIEGGVDKSEINSELYDTYVPAGIEIDFDGDKLSPDAGPDTINRAIKDREQQVDDSRDESEIFQIETVLSEPRDENDFVQKFGAITSYLYERSPQTRNDIRENLLGKEMKPQELVEFLMKIADGLTSSDIDTDTTFESESNKSSTNFNGSIGNLKKYCVRNIDGIIFESAQTQKYRLKLDTNGFVSSIKSFIKNIKDYNLQSDVFGSYSFFDLSFKYEKIDSETGNQIATSVNQFIDKDSKLSFEESKDNTWTGKNPRFPQETLNVIIDDDKTVRLELLDASGTKNDDTQLDSYTFIQAMNQVNLQTPTVIDDFESLLGELRDQNASELVSDLAESGVSSNVAEKVVDSIKKTASSQNVDQKKAEVVNTIQELLKDKTIKKMSDSLYREDGELINVISGISPLDFASMKSGDEQVIINFKASIASQLNPNIDVLKPMIRDIFKGELKPVFDSLFLGRESFNEEKFKAIYSQLILSSFDKLVDIKQGRITEGLGDLMRKAGRAIKSGLANITAMAPILVPVATACYYAIGTTIFPYIMAGFGAWNIFSAIKDASQFKKEKEKYRKNPLKYIEESIFNDKKARKTISSMVSHLTADVVASRINPSYQIKRKKQGAGIVAGTSDWSKKLDAQLEEYNNFSKEDKAKAKIFNDRMIDQIKQTRYGKLGIISEGVVNEIFNEVMFGSKRISPEVRNKLFNGSITSKENEEELRQLAKSLHTAIAYSSVKNNFIRFIEERVREASKLFSKDSQRFAIELRDDQLDKNTKGRFGDVDKFEEWRKPFRGIQRNQQLFISPEQITEDFIGKLLVELTGMKKEEYNSELSKAPTQFNEDHIVGSLAKLLFEDKSAEEENRESQDKLEDERRAANKQRNLTMPEAAGLGGINWAGSLYQTFYVDTLINGSKSIFKSGFKVGTKKISSVNVTDAFCKNPAAANALNQMGFDPGHALIQGVSPYNGSIEKIFFYYYDGAEGANKLSGILIKADGSCLELGHGKSLFGWFAKNAAWAKKFGVAVDAKKGTASAIGSGKSLAANSVEMKSSMISMKSHLTGSYKAQVTAAQMKTNTLMLDNEIAKVADLLDNKGHVTPETFNDIYEALHKTYSQMIEATGDTPSWTPSEQMKLIIDNVNAKIDAASRTSPEMWDTIKRGMEDFVGDADVKAADQALRKAEIFYRDNLSIDYDLGTVSDQTQSAKQAWLAAQEKAAAVKASAFKIHMGKLSSSEIELFSKEAILKATGSTAQAGFNPILDVSVQSVKKSVSFLQKMSPIKIGDTSTLEKIATIALKSDAAVIAASKVLGPVGLLSKVCAKFYRRGIKGGEFAEQFYGVFKPQQLVYSDMLYAICGAEVPGRSKVDSADANGGMKSSLMSLSSPTSQEPTLQLTSMPSNVLINNQKDLNAGVTESFVYTHKLSDYLFENRLVTKRKKVSNIKNKKLANEINEHKKLQDMFKNMF